MLGFNGGLIGKTNLTVAGASIPGVWTSREQEIAVRRNQWTGTSDPSYSSVSLLLHADGANGSTTITDNSPTPKSPSSQSNVSISNALSKFPGGTSFICTDSSTILYSGFSSLGGGDWTVELFAYRTSGTDSRALLDTRKSGAADGLLMYLSSSTIRVNFAGGDRITATSTLPSNQWVHIALTRSSSTTRLFQDGVLMGSSGQSFDGAASTDTRIMGVFNASNWGFNGHIEEYRITTGVARYTDAFPVPTSPFPDF